VIFSRRCRFPILMFSLLALRVCLGANLHRH
jgi:hypothetical protein